MSLVFHTPVIVRIGNDYIEYNNDNTLWFLSQDDLDDGFFKIPGVLKLDCFAQDTITVP